MLLAGCTNCGEELNETKCFFTVAPHDARADSPPGIPTGPLLYGEVRKGDFRDRTITISNSGSNVPLTQLSVQFSAVNADSYSLVGNVPEVNASQQGTLTVRFSPVPIDTDVGNTVIISHPDIDGAKCPTWTVTLRGRALPPAPPDAGTPDASVPDGGNPDGGLDDAGMDAGQIFPRPDAGRPLTDGGHFEARGGLQTARSAFGAALLATGEILVVGGFDHTGQVTSSTEILDPHTGLSRPGPELQDARARHSVTRLQDGRVVVYGGVNSGALGVTNVLDSVEVLDVGATQFVRNTTGEPRADHVAIADGTGVVVAWGLSQSDLGMPLVPADGAMRVSTLGTVGSVTADMGAMGARTGVAVVDLEDGSTLLLGGADTAGNPLDSVVRYAGAQLRTLTPTLLTPRARAVAARFKDGPVVVVGGLGANGVLSDAERVDVSGGDDTLWVFEAVDTPVQPRMDAQMFRVLDDVLVVSGGLAAEVTDGGVLARQDAELLVHLPSLGVLVSGTANDPSIPRVAAAAVAYDGGVAVLGGSVTAPRRSARPDVDRFLPQRTRFESMGLVGPGGAASAAPGANVLVAGGTDLTTGRPSSRTRIYGIQTGAVAEGPDLLAARTQASAAIILADGSILVAGGVDGTGQVLAQCERVLGDLSRSVQAASMATPRRQATATVLADGRVLLCGGLGAGSEPLDTCELYDPAMDRFVAVTGHMVRGRAGHSATLLDSGKVFLTGGNDPALAPFRGDLFDPVDDRVRATTGFPMAARRNHVAALVGVGKVLLAGGETYVGQRVPTDTVEVWDEATESYSALSPLSVGRDGPVGLLFLGGITLLTGGAQAVTDDPTFPTRALVRTEYFNPAEGDFRNVDTPLRFPRAHATGVDPLGSPVVMFGEGRHGLVGPGLEARIPLSTLEVWVP